MTRGAVALAVAALVHCTVLAAADAPAGGQPAATSEAGTQGTQQPKAAARPAPKSEATTRATPASVGPDGLTDDELRRVLRTLQRGLRADDTTVVSSVVVFPLRVNTLKGSKRIQGPRAFSAEYDTIFTPSVREAILEQEPGTLMRSYRGAMIGSGEAWISGVCSDAMCTKYRVGITAIGTAQ